MDLAIERLDKYLVNSIPLSLPRNIWSRSDAPSEVVTAESPHIGHPAIISAKFITSSFAAHTITFHPRSSFHLPPLFIPHSFTAPAYTSPAAAARFSLMLS